MDFDPSLMQDFLTESGELIEQLDQDLVQMESADDETQKEVCNSAFRALHTIKGAASFLGLTAVTTFAHAAEDALNKLRKGEVAVTPAIMDALLQSADVVREQIDALGQGDTAPDGPQALIATLHAISEGKAGDAPAAPSAADAPAESADAPASAKPGEPLDLPGSKLDLLPFMTAERRDSFAQIETAAEELADDTARADAAHQIADLVVESQRTAEFFDLPALSRLVQAVADAAPALDSLQGPAIPEVVVRLRALRKLIDAQCDAMDDGRLLKFPTKSLRARLTAACANQPLPEDVAGKHDHDVKQLLVLDGVIAAPAPAADTPDNPQPAATSDTTTPANDARTGNDRRQGERRNAPAVEQTIRVEVGRLESLLNLVGQLVLNKNRVLALTRSLRDVEIESDELEHFTTAASDLDRLTGELQVGVMRTRMQPLAKLFDRYPRVIRDIARATDKQIDLVIEGKDTEVDKSVIEALADPLVHILRNSADHGVEMPADRAAAGKPERGTITLSAEHQGSHVRVAITDDGKGLDREVLGAKAIEKGITTPEQLAQTPDSEVFKFIFGAGFSTAKQVSDLSGRGVGMDVVRTNINKVNGEIHIDSAKGKGTTIEILIPLTVAIMPAMVVGVGEHLYSIPLQCVVEIVKPEDLGTHTVSGYPVMRLRDSVLPLLNLRDALDEAGDGPGGFAVVIGVGGTRIGLCVDRLVGQQEIVIKPLDDDYTQGGPFSGATIREDGEVSLILDVPRLVREASQQVNAVDQANRDATASAPHAPAKPQPTAA